MKLNQIKYSKRKTEETTVKPFNFNFGDSPTKCINKPNILVSSNSISKKHPKTLLRYPGGKNRATKAILPYIPENVTKLCSPFLGGGSVELACTARGINVYGYDIFSPLIDFWNELLENKKKLVNTVQNYFPLSKLQFYNLQKTYLNLKDKTERAAVFFVINRCSFSGTTLSGGMSPGHPRFTQSAINRLKNFEVQNLQVEKKDFRETLEKHKNTFLYLDPPYANGQALYGNKGDMHKGFEHDELANILSKKDKWILSYNDCEKVRKLYKNFKFIELSWTYGMNNSKKSNEVLILSQDLSA